MIGRDIEKGHFDWYDEVEGNTTYKKLKLL